MGIAPPVAATRQLNNLGRLTVLRTHGHYLSGPILSEEISQHLSSDAQTAMERGVAQTGALPQSSDALLEVLEHTEFGSLIDGVIGDDGVLSIVQSMSGCGQEWQYDFAHIRRSVPPRSFRCGVTVMLVLGTESRLVEVLRGSQNLPEGMDAETASFIKADVEVHPGCVLILEAGVHYRLQRASHNPWLKFQFIRPWIKPHILYSSALEKDRLARFGSRGRRWCGLDVGLPTSIEEFLAIEQAALEGATGRAKGSGI
jgi:hypothetical protein